MKLPQLHSYFIKSLQKKNAYDIIGTSENDKNLTIVFESNKLEKQSISEE